MAKTTNAVVLKEEYSVMSASEQMQEAIEVNLGGGKLSLRDLERIKISPGGVTSWKIFSVDGEDSAKKIEGIVVHFTDSRVYWEKEYGKSDGPQQPDCISDNLEMGVGNPGGKCSKCQFAKFGSRGRAQACKLVRLVFICVKGEMFPKVIVLPPSSVAICKQYFQGLGSKGVPYFTVETQFELEKATNKSNIAYSRLVVEKVRSLDANAVKAMRVYREQIKPLLEVAAREDIEQSDVGE